MSNKHDLIYYCDSYPAIGNGHLKRGLDILQQLLKIKPTLNLALAGKFSESGWHFLQKLKPDRVGVYKNKIPAQKFKIGILDTIYPGDASTIPEDRCRDLNEISDEVIAFNTGIKTFIPDCVDGIINYIPVTEYTGNQDVKKFLGVEYAPVSPSFKPGNTRFNKKILCMIGGNQQQYGPERLCQQLKSLLSPDYKVDFILSPHFPESKAKYLINKYPAINFHQNLKSVVEYVENSQCVITTYGNATWEALTMHKPVFIVSYLDFQKYFASYLAEKGYAVDLGYLKDLNVSKLSLLMDDQMQQELIKSIRKKFKAPGIINITNLLLEELDVSH